MHAHRTHNNSTLFNASKKTNKCANKANELADWLRTRLQLEMEKFKFIGRISMFIFVAVFPWFHLVVHFELNCVLWLSVSWLFFPLVRWVRACGSIWLHYIAPWSKRKRKRERTRQQKYAPNQQQHFGRRCHLVLFCFLENLMLLRFTTVCNRLPVCSATYQICFWNGNWNLPVLKRIKEPLLHRNLLWWNWPRLPRILQWQEISSVCFHSQRRYHMFALCIQEFTKFKWLEFRGLLDWLHFRAAAEVWSGIKSIWMLFFSLLELAW